MTLPNGPDGLSDLLGLAFPVSAGDGSVSAQKDNDQPTVEALLKSNMQESSGWQGANAAGFAGLPGGLPLVAGIVVKIAEQFTGIDISHFLDMWTENPVVDALGDVVGSAFGAIFTVSANIQSLFGSLNFLDPDWDPQEMLGIWINVITSGFGLLGPNSPLNARNLFGLLLPGLFGSVPLGTVTDERPNLIGSAANYPAGSITPGGDWDIDATSSRTADGTGSMKVTANGRMHALRSGKTPADKIGVSKGQTIVVTTNVSYQGYTGTGETVLLQVQPFRGNVQEAAMQIAAYAPPNGTLAWPGYQLTGKYVVPDGVTDIQTRKVVTDQALAGDLFFDDDDTGQDGKFHMDWIDGLPESLQESAGRWQGLVDTWVNVITGQDNLGHGLEELADAILHIPSDFVMGVLGPGTIAGDALAILNSVVGGWVDAPDGTGATLADVFNIGKWVSAGANFGYLAMDLLGVRNNTTVSSSFLPSGRSNIPLAQVMSQATPGYVAVAAGASAVASDRIEVSQPLGVISWMGYGYANVTGLYLHVWKVDASGTETLAHASANLTGLIDVTATSANPKFHRYLFAAPPATEAGEEYFYEWSVTGTGTHYIVCDVQGTWAPDDPHATIDSMGYTRNDATPATPPTTIAKSAFVSSNLVPWVEIAIDLGITSGYHEPFKTYRNETGSIPIPSWVKWVRVAALGPSSKAAAGSTLGFEGNHGKPGVWGTIEWERGVDFTGDLSLTYTMTAASTVATLGANTVTVAKPADSTGTHFGHSDAPGVNPIEFKGTRYDGGGPQGTAGKPGIAPGGAPAGGNGLIFGPPGAPSTGAVWLELVQGEVTGAPVPGTATLPGIASGAAFGSHTVTMPGVTGELPAPDRAAIDAIFATEMALNKQPGTMVALWSPKGGYQKAYGKVSATGAAISLDQNFYIGSMTKLFTMWAFLREVDKGNVSLDDFMDEHIPGIPNGATMTMRHVMSMQSGIFDYQNGDLWLKIVYFFLTPMAAYSADSAVASIKGNPASFLPGTAYQYNNGNYVLLGKIVEKYNPGRTLKQVFQEDLWTPLGLTRTQWPANGAPPTPAAGATANNNDLFWGSGCCSSTMGDMLKWGFELRDGTLLSPTMHDEWMNSGELVPDQPYPGNPGPDHFNYGYANVATGSYRGHDGAITGWGSNCSIEPHTGTVIVTMENISSPNLGAFARLFMYTAEYLYPGSDLIPDYGVTQTVGPVGGVDSGAAFGELRSVPPGAIGLDGIPSSEAFGSHTIVPPTPRIKFDNFVYGATNYAAAVGVNIPVTAGEKTITAAVAASAGVSSVTCDGLPMTRVDIVDNLSMWKVTLPAGNAAHTASVVASIGTGGATMCVWSHEGVASVALAAKQSGGVTFGPVAVTPNSGEILLQVWAAFNYSASLASIAPVSGGTVRLAGATDGNRTGMCASEAGLTTTFVATYSPTYISGTSAMAVKLT